MRQWSDMAYISALYGARGLDWKKGHQLFFEKIESASTHAVPTDLITIELADGSRMEFEFDLTSVYGRAKRSHWTALRESDANSQP